MIRSFKNQGTEDLFNGVDTKAARKICPQDIRNVARRKLGHVDAAETLEDLKSPGNMLKKLEKDRAGQHAIRVNDQFRICFIWSDGQADQVEVTDYH